MKNDIEGRHQNAGDNLEHGRATGNTAIQRVEKEKLDRIIEAGRIAPSACNAQPWKFIVVD
ncbi:MAG: nitroreductase family protein [Marinilabiliales bacterium]|nr:nitroreductase family protein [Marinilabiliales bacterium]